MRLAAAIVLAIGMAMPAAAQLSPGPPGGAAVVWLPRRSADLQVLDKVNARHSVLAVAVGKEARYGTLTIGVASCVVRPANQPADAAAFLTVTDSNNEGVAFKGWMVAGQPALSMLQHPVFDVRVVGCTP